MRCSPRRLPVLILASTAPPTLLTSRPVRRVALLLACAVVLAGCTSENKVADVPAVQGSRTDGPVAFLGDPGLRQTAGMRAGGGEKVVFGATEVRNDGSDPVTLEAGELVGDVGENRAAVTAVRVIDTTQSSDLVGAGPWPFESYGRRSVPLAGYTLQPGTQVELLFIVSVEETGLWYWPQTMVRYVSNDENYHAALNFGFVVCPPAKARCGPPASATAS